MNNSTGQALIEMLLSFLFLLTIGFGSFQLLSSQWVKLKCHIGAFEETHHELFTRSSPSRVEEPFVCENGLSVTIPMEPLE